MQKNQLVEYLEFAKSIAEQSGKIMLKHFRADSLITNWKSDNSPVTIADLEINKLVINSVKSAYPNHGVIGEEESYMPQKDYVWVVDPIDGTAMYDLGMPNSTFCLALVVEGEVWVSVVLDPYTNRLFWATKDGGTFKNGQPLTTPKIKNHKHTYAFIPTGSRQEPHLFEELIISVKSQGAKVLFIPSFSYLSTLVIEGLASVALMAYGSPWDSAAISLIAKEAGCVVTNLSGTPRKYNEWSDGIIVSNSNFNEFYLEAVKNAYTRH